MIGGSSLGCDITKFLQCTFPEITLIKVDESLLEE